MNQINLTIRNCILIGYVLLLNAILLGGGIALATGHPSALPLFYVAAFLVAIGGWGGPLFMLAFSTREVAREEGVMVAAKMVAEGALLFSACVGGVFLLGTVLMACHAIASVEESGTFTFYLRFGIAFSLYISPFVFAGFAVRESLATRTSVYQQQLIDRYSSHVYEYVAYPKVETIFHGSRGIEIRDSFLRAAISHHSTLLDSYEFEIEDGNLDHADVDSRIESTPEAGTD